MAFCLVFAVGCDSEHGFPDARIPDAMVPGGTVSLSWTVTDTNDAAAITCDEANATTVTVTLREEGASSGFPDPFNCSSGQATTQPHPPGTYVLGFELRGPTGQISTAPGQNGIEIRSGQDTPIGAIDFPVDAQGALTLNVAAANVMSNCGLIADMGGNIDAITFELERDATCVPFDYTINATPGTTTCPPTPVACFEPTDDIVAAVLDSGRYQVRATGLIGGAECWVGTQEIRVPTAGGSAQFQVNMAYQPTVVGCPPMP